MLGEVHYRKEFTRKLSLSFNCLKAKASVSMQPCLADQRSPLVGTSRKLGIGPITGWCETIKILPRILCRYGRRWVFLCRISKSDHLIHKHLLFTRFSKNKPHNVQVCSVALALGVSPCFQTINWWHQLWVGAFDPTWRQPIVPSPSLADAFSLMNVALLNYHFPPRLANTRI